MIQLYEDLLDVLETEFDLCTKMLELLQREKDVIVSLDHKALEDLLAGKHEISEKIRMCDVRREKILGELGFGHMTISEVAEIAVDEYKPSVDRMASRFRSVIQSITELNRFNSLLIEKSLYYLKTSYNFLNTFDIKPRQKVSVEV
ncbi:MAG: flagellar protein FlgN [Nitrospirae bacterium]|nr:MAG: flagellar protein FlgN [Nitrospirota bacterium]